jgi:hypothetical protein
MTPMPATPYAPGSAQEALLKQASLPLAALFVGYPLWWALGVQLPMWPLLALPVAFWLLVNRTRIALPPGYGVLLLFLAWVLLSALMLTDVRYAASYLLRLSLYGAVFVFAIFAWNALNRGLDAHRVILWVAAFWASIVVLSYPGILIDNLEFTSPFEWLLNHAGVHDPFVTALVHPEFSEYDRLYGVPRPSPLFAYTNDWGAAMGILTPVAVWACVTARRTLERLVLAGVLVASIVPIIVSVNRGCWISLAVGFGYVVFRRVAVGQVVALLGAAGSVLLAFGLYLQVSDIHRVVNARFDYANTSTRETLYEASFRLASSSPLVGYGSPQSSAGLADSNNVSIGTHGQLWTILVSQGYVGAGLFLAAAAVIWWCARPRDGASPDVWLHATGLVMVVQIAFYEVLPVPLTVALLAMAVCGVNRRRLGPPARRYAAPDRKEGSHEPLEL